MLKIYELYDFGDGNDDILSDIGNVSTEIRRGMWGLMPYSVSDGTGVINEKFISLVSNRNKYPDQPVSQLPILTKNFNECISNLKEALKHVKNKRQFYENLLVLQEYLVKNKQLDADVILSEVFDVPENPQQIAVQGFSLTDPKEANTMAQAFAAKMNLGQVSKSLGGGGYGFAYLLNNNQVLKFTTDIGEIDAAVKIQRAKPQTLANVYGTYKVFNTETGRAYFSTLSEFIANKPFQDFVRHTQTMEKLGLDWGGFLIDMKKFEANYDNLLQTAQSVLTINPEATITKEERQATNQFLFGIMAIKRELISIGIPKANDYSNLENLGYRGNVLVHFDIGAYRAEEPAFSELIVLPEGLEEAWKRDGEWHWIDEKVVQSIAEKLKNYFPINQLKFIDSGGFGDAYDIGNDRVLKITTDKSEAVENLGLIGKNMERIANPYAVFRVISRSNPKDEIYVIVLEKLTTYRNEFEMRMERLKYVFENIFKTDFFYIIDNIALGYADKMGKELARYDAYFRKNSEDKEFFDNLVAITKEIHKYGIESMDYISPRNLGYKKDGKLAVFDIGFGNPNKAVFNPKQHMVIPEDGSSKFSTDTALGQDEFPVYNQNDTSDPIKNDLDANRALYEGAYDKPVYHLTTEKNAESILKNGFNLSNTGYVHFSSEPHNMNIKSREGHHTIITAKLNIHNPAPVDKFWKMNDALFEKYDPKDERLKNYSNFFNSQAFADLEKERYNWFIKNGYDSLITPQDIWVLDPKVIEILAVNQDTELKEDLEYNHVVGDATEDEYQISEERNKSFMPNSQAVGVKKKCRIGGLGNTSAACNQGDIKNLEFSKINEGVNVPRHDFDAWITPDNNFIEVESEGHLKYIRNVYKNISDQFEAYDKAIADGWVRVAFRNSKTNTQYRITTDNELSLQGYNEDRIKNVLKTLFYDLVKNGTVQIYMDYAETKDYDHIDPESSNGVTKLVNYINEEIDASEAYKEKGALKTLLRGKRNVAFLWITKPVGLLLEKRGYGVIPVRILPDYTLYAIVYNQNGKKDAERLYQIAKSKGGFLNDKTAEEAREIGKLLGYSDASIEEFIRRQYPSKVPLAPTYDDYRNLDEIVSPYHAYTSKKEEIKRKEDEMISRLDKTFANSSIQYLQPYMTPEETKIVYDDLLDSRRAAEFTGDERQKKLELSRQAYEIKSRIWEEFKQKDPEKYTEYSKIVKQYLTTSEKVRKYFTKQIIGLENSFSSQSNYAYGMAGDVEANEISHFTKTDNAINILRDGYFMEGDEGGVSFTTNKNLIKQRKPVFYHPQSDGYEGTTYRNLSTQFVMDFNKLKQDGFKFRKGGDAVGTHFGEEEIRVYPKKGEYDLPLQPYLKKVIFDPTKEKKLELQQQLMQILKEKNIPYFNKNNLNEVQQTSYEKYYRVVPEFIGDIVEFQPEGEYEAVDDEGNPVIKHDMYTKSDVGEIAASKSVGGAVMGLYSMLKMHRQPINYFYVYEINDKPDVDISHWSGFDFSYLQEVRFRKPVIGKYLGKVQLTDNIKQKLDAYYEIVGSEDFGQPIYDPEYERASKIVQSTNYDKLLGGVRKMVHETEVENTSPLTTSLQNLPFRQEVEQHGGKIYSVGGAVRDELAGVKSKDLDIVIAGIPKDELIQLLSKYGDAAPEGKSFGIIIFRPRGASETIDIALPRMDFAMGGGGHKDIRAEIDHAMPIEKDLERRDITINSMAKDINGNLIDPYGGQEDLKNHIIRMTNPDTFDEDPLRMIRAIRFASRFRFKIEPETLKTIQNSASTIKKITGERIRGEFVLMLKQHCDLSQVAFLLKQTGLLREIFGTDSGILVSKNIWDNIKTLGEFIWVLSHNLVSNPALFYKNNLKGDIPTMKEIQAIMLAYNHENERNPINVRLIASQMYKIYPQSLESQILPQAIQNATNELLSGKYPKSTDELAISGNDIMQATGLPQGEKIGEIKNNLLVNIYSDKVRNNREELLSLLSH